MGFRCHVSDKALEGIDNAIELIGEEMNRCNTKAMIALAKALRDIVVARAILTEMTGDLEKF